MSFKTCLVGQRFKNNKGLEFEITEYCSDTDKRKIKFIKTGYECEAHRDNIKKGIVKDWRSPTICDVGVMDVKNGTKHNLYVRWMDMINRCYDKNHSDYKYYGGNGVTVDKRWHNFSNYINDIEAKENYEKIILDTKNWHVDKDILIPGNKVYSNETTCIVHISENTTEKNVRNANKK